MTSRLLTILRSATIVTAYLAPSKQQLQVPPPFCGILLELDPGATSLTPFEVLRILIATSAACNKEGAHPIFVTFSGPDLSGSTAETTLKNTVLIRHFVPVISWQRNSKDMAPLPLQLCPPGCPGWRGKLAMSFPCAPPCHQLQSVHLETFVSLFSSQLLGTEVACRDIAPSLPSMKTDMLDKQVRCCGCWCPPSVLAALTTLGCVLALASGKILTSAFARFAF